MLVKREVKLFFKENNLRSEEEALTALEEGVKTHLRRVIAKMATSKRKTVTAEDIKEAFSSDAAIAEKEEDQHL